MSWGVIDRIEDGYVTVLVGEDAISYDIPVEKAPKKLKDGMRCHVTIENNEIVLLVPDIRATIDAKKRGQERMDRLRRKE
ncbi:DUF3006 domain-containing protein [Aureibacillus halotolerans]|uniref:DUF3006 family protein n=1 Tax=Aureibacillus halotolerans TaxID=1508390 RepID=A0A4R6UAG4_9BACI|nr:DUF3006 domain-containing protein [Aureibacillus halotolerans]TDQ42862.1 DUF3006 family protein [Aureibacillus halotolerans]